MRTPTSKPSHHKRARAFALIEAAAILAVLATLSAIFIVIGNRGRQLAMASDDLANLRHIGQLTGQYVADNQDFMWAFSWKKGQALSQYPDLNISSTDLEAQANQAVDIARRLTGSSIAEMPKIFGWFPHTTYTHLVLEDYAGMKIPNRMFIGTGDRYRLLWTTDLAGFKTGEFLPYQPSPSSIAWRWPYSASFSMPPAFYAEESGPNAPSQSGNNYNMWSVIGSNMGVKPISSIAHPSHKVLVHESHSRHFGKRQPFFAVGSGEARVPLLLVDGSADVGATAAANKGWNPSQPTSQNPSAFIYNPTSANALWDPPTVNGPNPSDSCYGYYRFTRNGSLGRDFGGPEIPYP